MFDKIISLVNKAMETEHGPLYVTVAAILAAFGIHEYYEKSKHSNEQPNAPEGSDDQKAEAGAKEEKQGPAKQETNADNASEKNTP